MATPDTPQPQPLTLTEALIPIASLIILVAISFYLFGDAGALGPNQVALVVATMVAVFIAWRRGHTLEALREAAVASIGSGTYAILILLAVGSLIGTWAMSGTLGAMVYYGLQLLSPNYFYMTACLICAIISASIGTSWTTAGTVGIGLVGIAVSMDLNPAIAAAAVISGAYVGDTSSPLSDSANLAAAAAGVDLYDHIRETAITSGLSLVIALAVFWMLGQPGAFDASEKMAALQSVFHPTLMLFIPLLVVLALAILKFPPFTTIFLGALTGALLAVIVAPERVIAFADAGDGIPRPFLLLKGVWLALASGYKSETGYAMIDHLVTRGGMESMLNTIWLIITALAFGGVVEKAGVVERLIEPVIKVAKSAGSLVASTVGAVIATNIVTADQFIAIVLPGRMFKSAFENRGFAPVVLSRTIGASGTPTGALIPWNSCGAFLAATLGVPTMSFLPYAVFNFVSPLLAIAFAYLGIRMMRVAGTQQQTSTPRKAAGGDAR
jgi:Na+:H+ antiporter, NhaC family